MDINASVEKSKDLESQWHQKLDEFSKSQQMDRRLDLLDEMLRIGRELKEVTKQQLEST